MNIGTIRKGLKLDNVRKMTFQKAKNIKRFSKVGKDFLLFVQILKTAKDSLLKVILIHWRPIAISFK
jgi:hypothetical protein